jgi:3D (Asp-Asp-Asp) domain-containing protein
MTTQVDRDRALGTLLKDGVRYIVDLIDRIVNGIRGIAPLVVQLGCQSTTVDPSIPPPPIPHEVAAPRDAGAAPAAEPTPIGKFTITFYYVVGEDEVAAKPTVVAARAANDNHARGSGSDTTVKIDESDSELTAITAPEQVTLFETKDGKTCEPIAEVSRDFATQLALQGTGKLKDGRVLNIWGQCRCDRSPCFKVTSATWGTGGSGRQLQPFRTVAVDPKVIKLGSLLYVPLLEGKRMPGRPPWGGFVHDGCVVADDVGGGILGTQLDLFVGRRGWFLGMHNSGGSHAWARHIPVYDGTKRCERKGRQVARKTGAI